MASAGGLTIAVPSRLYFTPSQQQPLAGLRLAVKDLMDLKGIKTSGGNRAYYEMIAAANKTASSIQRLIKAGAVVVGKTKLSEFAFAAPWVTDHTDYLLPFNPRGDGQNLVADSSVGSGSCTASYDWIDAALGTDTGGSVRAPALVNGVYGNRPTHGAVGLDGIIPLSPAMDTVGTFTRDPILMGDINKVLYAGSSKFYSSYPKQIFLDPGSAEQIDAYRHKYATAADAADKFLAALAKVTSGQVTTFSVDDLWNKLTLNAVRNATIASITNKIYGTLVRYEQWNLFGKSFVERYESAHDGEFPHIVPSTREGWLMVNATMNEATHQDSLKNKGIVTDWVSKEFLSPHPQSCSNALYVYFSFPSAQYRVDASEE